MTKTTRASLELTVAAFFWGFGFIGMIWALETLTPLGTTFWRFFLSGLLCLPMILLMPRHREYFNIAIFKKTFLPGFFLAATLILQNWGLLYTTATKSSFITTLYVIFVPLIESAARKKSVRPLHMLLTFLALVGTALIVQLKSESLNIGDALTFVCAIAASFQIFWLGHKKDFIENAFVFNSVQCLWVAVFSAVGMLFFRESFALTLNENSVMGLAVLIGGSTLIAFYFQARAQKVLLPGVSSLLCLLESPFATLFAFWLLQERLSLFQWLGIITIFSATSTSALIEAAIERQSLNLDTDSAADNDS